jgi:hypothetical protein
MKGNRKQQKGNPPSLHIAQTQVIKTPFETAMNFVFSIDTRKKTSVDMQAREALRKGLLRVQISM